MIEGYVDEDKWREVHEREREARKPLKALGENWPHVARLLTDDKILGLPALAEHADVLSYIAEDYPDRLPSVANNMEVLGALAESPALMRALNGLDAEHDLLEALGHGETRARVREFMEREDLI